MPAAIITFLNSKLETYKLYYCLMKHADTISFSAAFI